MLLFAASFKESEPSHALFLYQKMRGGVRNIITTWVRMDSERETLCLVGI
jgi:hypothetical protein